MMRVIGIDLIERTELRNQCFISYQGQEDGVSSEIRFTLPEGEKFSITNKKGFETYWRMSSYTFSHKLQSYPMPFV
jgi:hypothetical protein